MIVCPQAGILSVGNNTKTLAQRDVELASDTTVSNVVII